MHREDLALVLVAAIVIGLAAYAVLSYWLAPDFSTKTLPNGVVCYYYKADHSIPHWCDR